jgi:hypothetical protein
MANLGCCLAAAVMFFTMLFLWMVRPDIARYYCAEWWIRRAYRNRQWARAEARSREYLAQAERFHWDWNYGNAVHNGNQFIGLVRLRQGDLSGAKEYLIRAGLSPGSPQLDSFGPAMPLARELLERGERVVVAEYIDLVAAFWTREKPRHADSPCARAMLDEKTRLVQQWKLDIAAGRVPDYYLWQQPA